MSRTGVLEVHARRPRLLVAIGAVLVFAAVGAGVWNSDPAPLPVSDTTVNATTPVGEPVYLGVVTTRGDFGRELHLAGIKVHATSNTGQVSISPLLCRGGAVGVTTDPRAFCSEVVDPEGETLRPGDAIVLQVLSEEPAIAVIDRVRVAFRESLRWGTLDAGSPSVVTVIPR